MATAGTTDKPELMEPPEEDFKKRGGPSIRRADHLKSARLALLEWRMKTKRMLYSPSPFTASTILPDMFLTTLASNARIQTVEDIAATLKKPWMLLDKHGEEVLDILRKVDQLYKQVVKTQRQRKREAKQASKAALSATAVPSQHEEPLVGSSHFNVLQVCHCLNLPFYSSVC